MADLQAHAGSRRAAGFVLGSRPGSTRRLLADLWSKRGLVSVLARKDFFVRYRRASLGVFWAVGLPLVQAVVMTVVFSRAIGRFAHLGHGSYAVYVFSGIVAWTYFSGTLGAASTAIVDGASLSSRVYFPRAVLPLVPAVSNLYGLVITVAILVGMSALLGPGVGVRALFLLPAMLLVVCFTAALSLVFSALHVYFRDVRYIIQAGLIAWFYLTPVLYPLTMLHSTTQRLVELNPATGCVTFFHAATGTFDPGWVTSVVSCGVCTTALLVVAALLHRKFDRLFSDLL